MTQASGPPRSVVEAYALDPASIERLAIGLINETYTARRADGTACILQRISEIFPPEVNEDIAAVTAHLRRQRLPTPELLPTADDANYVKADGRVWRLLSRVEGDTVETLSSDAEAIEAGRVLGAFHLALGDFEEPLRCQRPAVHDLKRHLGALRQSLVEHREHAAHSAIASIAERLFALAATIEPLPESPLRIVHGDPKISNVIFRDSRGICLVDLDTIARMPVAVELGDALRSWCNPFPEDALEARFLPERFRASLEGYCSGASGLVTLPELQAVPNAALSIALELSARFAADALNESFFGWDRKRFSSASEHNRVRASSQLELVKDIARQLPDLNEVIMTLA